MSEFLVVRLPGDHTPDRRVCIDGNLSRNVGALIELEGPGDYIITLTNPQNYTPPAAQVHIRDTSLDNPQLVTFALEAPPLTPPPPVTLAIAPRASSPRPAPKTTPKPPKRPTKKPKPPGKKTARPKPVKSRKPAKAPKPAKARKPATKKPARPKKPAKKSKSIKRRKSR